MKKQNTIYLGIGIVVVILITLIVMFPNQQTESEVIKIGVITPLTGFVAETGQDVKAGLELGKEVLIEKGHIIELVYEDSQCDPKEAVSAYNRLALDSNIDIITGFVCSGDLLAIAPLAENNKKIILGTTASSPDISFLGSNIYRVIINDKEDARLNAEFIEMYYIKGENIVVLALNSDYGLPIKEEFVSQMEQKGYNTISESYNFGTTDFRTLILKFKNKGVSAVYFIGYPENTLSFLRQAKEQNLNAQILGSAGTLSGQFYLEENKEIVENYISTYYGVPNLSGTDFYDRFVDKYSREPAVYSDFAYDSMLVIGELIELGGFTEENFKKISVEGSTGSISFDSFGDRVGSEISLYKFNDSKIICEFGSCKYVRDIQL